MSQINMGISVIVSTRNRDKSLRRLLASMEVLQQPPVGYEMIIVDNGSTDETFHVLHQWAAQGENRKILQFERPGKSRALNRAIREACGGLLVFLDDDVVMDSAHLRETWNYFVQNDCAAAQGVISWPPEAYSNPEVRALLERYPVVVHVDLRNGETPSTLVGANMAVRRTTFDAVGPFHEGLGPGASGFSEDDELADRIKTSGMWIGAMRSARVVHEVDPSRLTEEGFRQRHRWQGRSRYVYKRQPLVRVAANYVWALVNYSFASLLGSHRQLYRWKGRFCHYEEMLRLAAPKLFVSSRIKRSGSPRGNT